MSRIKACPFCGNPYANKPEVVSYYNRYTGSQYFVECTYCGASSRHSESESEAVKAWNRREELIELRNTDNVKPKPKKYYLKHKYLGAERFAYLNYSHEFRDFELETKSFEDNFQTQFTEEEIKEIEKTGFDLTNFEKIEIK